LFQKHGTFNFGYQFLFLNPIISQFIKWNEISFFLLILWNSFKKFKWDTFKHAHPWKVVQCDTPNDVIVVCFHPSLGILWNALNASLGTWWEHWYKNQTTYMFVIYFYLHLRCTWNLWNSLRASLGNLWNTLNASLGIWWEH
jgi:hypothetical protein